MFLNICQFPSRLSLTFHTVCSLSFHFSGIEHMSTPFLSTTSRRHSVPPTITCPTYCVTTSARPLPPLSSSAPLSCFSFVLDLLRPLRIRATEIRAIPVCGCKLYLLAVLLLRLLGNHITIHTTNAFVSHALRSSFSALLG